MTHNSRVLTSVGSSTSSQDLQDFRKNVQVQGDQSWASRGNRQDLIQDVEFSQQSPEDDLDFGDDEIYGFSGSNSPYGYNKQSSSSYHKPVIPKLATPEEEDDALSVITEATEPEAPSIYSFHSSSTTLNESSDERMSLNLSREMLDSYQGDDINQQPYLKFLDQQRQKKQEKSPASSTAMSSSKDFSNKDNLFHPIPPISTSQQPSSLPNTSTTDTIPQSNLTHANRYLGAISHASDDGTGAVSGSYTINQGTVESAEAAGLPIISDGYSSSAQESDATAQESDATVIHRAGSSEPGSDFEEVPIILRNSSQNSHRSGSQSSSSGISADDGRFHIGSEPDDRVALHVYSSLSEQTGSPAIIDQDERLIDHLRMADDEDSDTVELGDGVPIEQAAPPRNHASPTSSRSESPQEPNEDTLTRSSRKRWSAESPEMNPSLGSPYIRKRPCENNNTIFRDGHRLFEKLNFGKPMKKNGDVDSPSPTKTTWLHILGVRHDQINQDDVEAKMRKVRDYELLFIKLRIILDKLDKFWEKLLLQ